MIIPLSIALALLSIVAVLTCLLPRLLFCSCLRSTRQRALGYVSLPSEEISQIVDYDPAKVSSALSRLLPLAADDLNDTIDAWMVPFLATSLPVLTLFSSYKFPFPLLGALHVSTTMTLVKTPSTPSGKAYVTWRPSDSRQTPKGVEIHVSVATPTLLFSHKYLFLGCRLPPTTALDKQALPTPRLEITPGPIHTPIPLAVSLATKWCELSQDFNPIHTSSILARLFGFKGRVAHGMSVVLLALRKLEGAKAMTSGTLFVSFQRPIVLPNPKSCVVCVGEESPGGGSPPAAGFSATITVDGKVCTTVAWTRGENQQ